MTHTYALTVVKALTLVVVIGTSVTAQRPVETEMPPMVTSMRTKVASPGSAKLTANALTLAMAYHSWKGLISIDGMANGNNPARFVIATGLSASTVVPKDVPRLQLESSEAVQRVTMLETSVEAPTANMKTMRIGRSAIADVKLARLDLYSLLTNTGAADGPSCWLGSDFLSRYQVTIDFEAHQVLLNPPTLPLPKTDGVVVPFKLSEGRPLVKVNVAGGGSFDAVVDTGSVGTLVPAIVAEKLKSKKADKTPGKSADIAGIASRIMLPSVSVGKAELKNLMAVYYSSDAPTGANKSLGVLGTDYLRRFRIIISYKRKQMMLLPLQEASQKAIATAPGGG